MRNTRKYMIHNITNKLIKENDIIVTENLDVKSMQRNHYMAKDHPILVYGGAKGFYEVEVAYREIS